MVRQTIYLAGFVALFCIGTMRSGHAIDQVSNLHVSWESRYAEETASGDIVDHPPFVAVNNVRLSRFSEMQSVTWRDTLKIDHGKDGYEELYVFTVWQGGASQGEQLMLLSVKPDGIAVIGPHGQDFEKLQIGHINSESAPEFDLMGADGSVLESLFYVLGDLVKNDE